MALVEGEVIKVHDAIHDHGYGEYPPGLVKFPVKRVFTRFRVPPLVDPTPEEVMAEVEFHDPNFLENLRKSGRDIISHMQSPKGKIAVSSAIGLAAAVTTGVIVRAIILHKSSQDQ